MASAAAHMRVTVDATDLRLAIMRLTHEVAEFEMACDLILTDPEVVVAGIEGRAIVRAGMRDVLRWTGEVE